MSKKFFLFKIFAIILLNKLNLVKIEIKLKKSIFFRFAIMKYFFF